MKGKTKNDDYFAFESMKYPTWADKYAPIDKGKMFQKFVLDPFNRILGSMNMPILNLDGSINISLFDF